MAKTIIVVPDSNGFDVLVTCGGKEIVVKGPRLFYGEALVITSLFSEQLRLLEAFLNRKF